MQMRIWTTDSSTIVYDGEQIDDPADELFDPDWWRRRDAIIATHQGRGTVYVVHRAPQTWVLRQYRRGGWMDFLTQRSYWWLGLKRSRPWREWHLLASLYKRGLPVPAPVAVRVRRRGLIYRGDILTTYLADTQPLARVLEQQALSPRRWAQIGALIRRFHAARVHHPDLNASNILCHRDGRMFILDFDRGRLPASATRIATELPRLRRSLEKFHGANPAFHYTAADWAELMRGYGSAA